MYFLCYIYLYIFFSSCLTFFNIPSTLFSKSVTEQTSVIKMAARNMITLGWSIVATHLTFLEPSISTCYVPALGLQGSFIPYGTYVCSCPLGSLAHVISHE